MKKKATHIITLLLVWITTSTAQSLVSGAENNKSNQYIINWTLGNTVSGSFVNNKYALTQGSIFNNYHIYFEEDAQLQIQCFPNPITNGIFFLEIKSNNPENYTWHIASTNGQILKQNKANKSLTKISIEQLKAPIYYLYIKNKKGQKVATAKLIKK